MKEKEWCIYVENVNVHVSGEVFIHCELCFNFFLTKVKFFTACEIQFQICKVSLLSIY